MATKSSYVEVKDKCKDKESVWHYFLREISGQSAKCKLCVGDKILKTGGGSTKSLHDHLKSAHNTNLRKRNTDSSNPVSQEFRPSTSDGSQSAAKTSSKKPKVIPDYFSNSNDDSLPATLSRLTARDCLPFSVFCTSPDMRNLLQAKGFTNVPKNRNKIRELVLNYAKDIRRGLRSEIQKRKEEGRKFSLTFDEWTSARKRRYMNVNLHDEGAFWSLGLIRVEGSMPAERCIELLEAKLSENGLSLENDIFSITTDGASVMVKVGKLLKADQQLCYAHGIHLAVTDVLYKKKNIEGTAPTEASGELMFTSNYDNDDEDSEEEDASGDDEEPEMVESISSVIAKVRKTIAIFRNSPTKYESTLKIYTIQEHGKELQLQKDCKTRWNSLLSMLERFYLLKNCIEKALIDLKSNVKFSKEEYDLVSDLIHALQPVKAAVDLLCRRDATLLTAEVALKFMLGKLKEQNSVICKEMMLALLARVEQRRTAASGVLQYLHNSNPAVAQFEMFRLPNQTSLRKFIKDRLSSHPPSIGQNTHVNFGDEYESRQENAPNRNAAASSTAQELKDELQQALEQCQSEETAVRSSAEQEITLVTIKKEMSVYEGNGYRGPILQRIRQHLLTVPPTSVESERAFSVAGNFCTKIRSRLGDNSIDALCFLKCHFKKLDQSHQSTSSR